MPNYPPVPVWHDPVFIPDDSAKPTAAAFNPSHEAELDMLAYLKARVDMSKCVPVVAEFLADGTITIPAGALPWIIYEGCGGGGGGGLGGKSPAAGYLTAGGGGGGGAVKRCGLCQVVPGETYSIDIGAGGSGVDLLFKSGFPGGDTVFTLVSTSTAIVTCRGAAGGQFGGGIIDPGVPDLNDFAGYRRHRVARGGKPVRVTVGAVLLDQYAEDAPFPTLHADYSPQSGGLGTSATWPTAEYTAGTQGTKGMSGNDSPEGFSGGLYGTQGTNVLSGGNWYYGGGAGGGGGAGAWGNGGAGGSGSNANPSGASAAPTAGVSAPPNSGAGGGGGGGAGAGSATTTLGANPGDGGSGRWRMIYFIPMQEP